MHTITLYKINQGYRVGESYRMYTEMDVRVPEDLKLSGVILGEPYITWFENVMKVIEQHMGDIMVDKWALPLMDAENETIAVCVDDVLVCPDLLISMISYLSPPQRHKNIVNNIKDAIQKREPGRVLRPIVFSPEWEMECYMNFLQKTYNPVK